MRLPPVLRHRRLVAQHKRDLHDPRQTRRHKGVPKHAVRHGADHELLRVRRHGPPGQEQHEPGHKVALGLAVPVPAQPHARQAGAPPDDAHGRVLPVVPHPVGAPPVLGEGVDAPPRRDDGAVKELLAAPGAAEPELADEQQDRQHDAVRDEGAAHDEVCQALAEVVALAEAQRGNPAKHHLDPRKEGEGLAVDAVQLAHDGPDARVDALLEVKLEVQTENDLGDHEDENRDAEARVDVMGDELAPLVQVTECIPEQGEEGREDLEGDVPSVLGDLPWHRCLSDDGDRGIYRRDLRLTPNTMPRGNRMPKANVWMKMCSHSIESCATRQLGEHHRRHLFAFSTLCLSPSPCRQTYNWVLGDGLPVRDGALAVIVSQCHGKEGGG